MHELIYYSDNFAKITGEAARLGGKSYRIADISSVEVCTTQTDSARNLPTFFIVAGSLLMFAVTNLQNIYPIEWDAFEPTTQALGMLIALTGLTILIIQTVLKSEYIYMISIKGTFGHACPFASDDDGYVRKIASALQAALKERRTEPTPALPELVDARQS